VQLFGRVRFKRRRAAHHDRPMEQSFGHWRDHVQKHAKCTDAVTGYSDAVGIASEGSYVPLDPSKRHDLILQAQITRSLRVAGA